MISDDHVDGMLIDQLNRCLTRMGFDHMIAKLDEHFSGRLSHGIFIIDQQNGARPNGGVSRIGRLVDRHY